MSLSKRYDGYTSFSYLEPGADYRAFNLVDELERVPPHVVPLSDAEESRVRSLVERCVFVSLHEHLGIFPDPIEDTPEYARHGRMATAFKGLAASHWDAVFDNLMDGICTIHSKSGWQWDDVLHDLGMRLCDIAHQDCWQAWLRGVDVVYHLAAQTSAYRAEEDPELDWRVNVVPMQQLLAACRTLVLPPVVVLAGTVTETGMTAAEPTSECHPDNPVTVYDVHKLAAEKYLLCEAICGRLRGCGLRLANVYGPGGTSSSADRGVLNLMIRRAISGQELTVYGTGEQIRDYVYIDDVVDAFLRAAVHVATTNGRFFVIGSGHGHSIANAVALIAAQVAQLVGAAPPVRHVAVPAGQLLVEDRSFVADARQFTHCTGWTARYDLVTGIRRTIQTMLTAR